MNPEYLILSRTTRRYAVVVNGYNHCEVRGYETPAKARNCARSPQLQPAAIYGRLGEKGEHALYAWMSEYDPTTRGFIGYDDDGEAWVADAVYRLYRQGFDPRDYIR
jgi:hypothetical protein